MRFLGSRQLVSKLANFHLITMERLSTNQDLSPATKLAISAHLRALVVDGRLHKLPVGTIKSTALLFGCSPKSVSRIWLATKESMKNAVKLPHFESKRKGRCGRPNKWLSVAEAIKKAPFRRRINLRSLAVAIGFSKTTIHRALKRGVIKRQSNAVKPPLTEENAATRLKFCLSKVQLDHDFAFDGMENRIFIDEKWFDMTKKTQTYYCVDDEEPPHRAVQSKRFIPKIMFMAAVMRPVFDAEGREVFSGKIGIWPFTETVLAQRSSHRRPAGTPEIKSVNVDRAEHRRMMVECVIPAIKQAVPPEYKQKELIIQQDGAKAHVLCDDPVVIDACKKDGWNIRVECQPANSPDLNILDLGFFAALQSLQHEFAPNDLEELIAATEKAFEDMTSTKLNANFLTMQQVMEKVIEVYGAKRYKIPHMGKDALRRRGELPWSICCNEQTYFSGWAYHFLTNVDEYI